MGIYVKEENQPWNHKQIAGNATGDNALDATSDNNIKNKVATAKFNEIDSTLEDLTGGGYLNTVDINTVLTPGSYLALSNCTHIPTTDSWYTLNVFAGGTGAFIQQAVAASNNTMYYRHHDGNGWSAWQRVQNAYKQYTLTGTTDGNGALAWSANPNKIHPVLAESNDKIVLPYKSSDGAGWWLKVLNYALEPVRSTSVSCIITYFED